MKARSTDRPILPVDQLLEQAAEQEVELAQAHEGEGLATRTMWGSLVRP